MKKKIIFLLILLLGLTNLIFPDVIDQFAMALEDLGSEVRIKKEILKYFTSLFTKDSNVLKDNVEKLSKKISKDDMKKFINDFYYNSNNKNQKYMPLIFFINYNFDDLLILLNYGADIDQKISSEGMYKDFDIIQYNLVYDTQLARVNFILKVLEKHKDLKTEENFKNYVTNIINFISTTKILHKKMKSEIFSIISSWAEQEKVQWLVDDIKSKTEKKNE